MSTTSLNPSSSELKLVVKPRSIVWQFYTLPPADSNVSKIKCPSCQAELKFTGSTTGIKNHLMKQHKESYCRLLKVQEKSNDHRKSHTNAELELAKSFVTGLIPFRFVENCEFRNFLATKPDDFKVPNQKKIKQIIDELAESHMRKVKQDLNGLKNFTVLTDGYSDERRNYHFYSIHITFIDENFMRKCYFLTLKKVDSGDNVTIGMAMNDAFEEFGLRFSECSVLTSDAGSPLVLLAEKHEIDRVHCSCHQLNLILTDFSKEKGVQRVQAKVQAFARFLSKHKDVKAKLQSLANTDGIVTPLPLPLSPTRWGALHTLIDRYLAIYDCVKDLSDLKEFLMKPDELTNMKEMSVLLKPIHDGILRLERDGSFTSEIIPTLFFIKKQVEKSTIPISRKLLECIQLRLDACTKNRRLLCSMLCDHRYAFSDTWDTLICWNIVEVDTVAYDFQSVVSTPDNNSMDECSDLDSFLDSSVQESSKVDDLQTEMIRYRALLLSNRPSYKDPLQFWRGQKVNFPRLSAIAKILLGSPASSSCSERSFSRCSDIIRQKKRNRISLNTINNILIVNELSKISRQHISKNEESDDDGDFTESDSSTNGESSESEYDGEDGDLMET